MVADVRTNLWSWLEANCKADPKILMGKNQSFGLTKMNRWTTKIINL